MSGKRRKFFRIRDFAHESYVARLIRKVLVPLVRMWFNTCRVTIIDEAAYKDYLYGNKPVVVGTWHRASIFFLYYFGPLHPMIMISQSKDGEILAQCASGFGVVPVRGSSGKGGRDALKRMKDYLTSGGKACATVLDGPQGPAYVAKKGMILLSKLTGAPFIPAIWSATRALTLRNSWDKMILPLPWSRIYIAAGDPIHIPANATNSELENYRKQIEDQLNTLMDELDRRCGYRS